MSNEPVVLSRRSFLKLSALFGASVAVGWRPWLGQLRADVVPPISDGTDAILSPALSRVPGIGESVAVWVDGYPLLDVSTCWATQQQDIMPWASWATREQGYSVGLQWVELTIAGVLQGDWRTRLLDGRPQQFAWTHSGAYQAWQSEMYVDSWSSEDGGPDTITAQGNGPVTVMSLEDFLRST